MMIADSTDYKLVLEKRQALLRVVILSTIFSYIFLVITESQQNKHLLLFWTGVFLSFSFLWYLIIHLRIVNSDFRRYFIILIDTMMNSVGVYLAGGEGVIFYPIYLFVTIGHGMRFGSNHLITSIVFSASGFAFVSMIEPYWKQHTTITLPLFTGLIVLPLYYLKLINQLNHANKQLKQELHATQITARYDKLTSLPNRYYLFTFLENIINSANRNKNTTFSILFIDLDGFKAINDKYGHAEGDNVLIMVSKSLSNLTRKSDIAARIGGDEFVLLLHGITDSTVIENVCRRLLVSLRKIDKKYQSSLSASIGISRYPIDSNNAEELIKKADQAMYKIKNRNKCGYLFSGE